MRAFSLQYNQSSEQWDLKHHGSRKLVTSFGTKQQATRGGGLQKALGSTPASVKIHKQNGQFQGERTYPQASDPARSKG